MLEDGVKWFDFLCPFSLKFAALTRFGPSARTSPLAWIRTWYLSKSGSQIWNFEKDYFLKKNIVSETIMIDLGYNFL